MQEQEQAANVESTAAEPQAELDPVKMQEFHMRLLREQNLPTGIVAGSGAALAGAVAWAAITVTTHYQIGYMAVGVGFLVGFAVRYFGHGITSVFSVAGYALALLGCLLGNLFSVCGFVAAEKSVPLLQVLSWLNPERAIQLLKATTGPMDLLFYGIALYAGFNYSVRRITPEELQSLAKEKA